MSCTPRSSARPTISWPKAAPHSMRSSSSSSRLAVAVFDARLRNPDRRGDPRTRPPGGRARLQPARRGRGDGAAEDPRRWRRLPPVERENAAPPRCWEPSRFGVTVIVRCTAIRPSRWSSRSNDRWASSTVRRRLWPKQRVAIHLAEGGGRIVAADDARPPVRGINSKAGYWLTSTPNLRSSPRSSATKPECRSASRPGFRAS